MVGFLSKDGGVGEVFGNASAFGGCIDPAAPGGSDVAALAVLRQSFAVLFAQFRADFGEERFPGVSHGRDCYCVFHGAFFSVCRRDNPARHLCAGGVVSLSVVRKKEGPLSRSGFRERGPVLSVCAGRRQ